MGSEMVVGVVTDTGGISTVGTVEVGAGRELVVVVGGCVVTVEDGVAAVVKVVMLLVDGSVRVVRGTVEGVKLVEGPITVSAIGIVLVGVVDVLGWTVVDGRVVVVGQ